MSRRAWITSAGLAAGVTIAAVLAVAVPAAQWTNDSLVAAAALVLSLILPAILPAPIPRNAYGDTAAVWLIGPLGALWSMLFLLGIIALVAGLSAWHTLAWVVCVLWAGSLAVGFALLNAGSRVADSASRQVRAAGDDPRARWAASLRAQSLRCEDPESQRLLNVLAEKLRYCANERAGEEAPETESISRLLEQIELGSSGAEQLTKLLRSAEILLETREQRLRASRALA
jgi:signal transduction histidine kinase